VEDDLHAFAGFRTDGWVGKIAAEKLHGFEADQILAFAGAEVVDAANGFAARKQLRGN
jgi:hypothetical protein